MEVHGLDLKQDIPDSVVRRIQQDVIEYVCSLTSMLCCSCKASVHKSELHTIKSKVQHMHAGLCAAFAGNNRPAIVQTSFIQLLSRRHRLVIFRDQGAVSGQRQVDISGWFGNLESTFYKHPKSPHPDIFRVSNNNLEGCTGTHVSHLCAMQTCESHISCMLWQSHALQDL